jgi:hypothetical protein
MLHELFIRLLEIRLVSIVRLLNNNWQKCRMNKFHTEHHLRWILNNHLVNTVSHWKPRDLEWFKENLDISFYEYLHDDECEIAICEYVRVLIGKSANMVCIISWSASLAQQDWGLFKFFGNYLVEFVPHRPAASTQQASSPRSIANMAPRTRRRYVVSRLSNLASPTNKFTHSQKVMMETEPVTWQKNGRIPKRYQN